GIKIPKENFTKLVQNNLTLSTSLYQEAIPLNADIRGASGIDFTQNAGTFAGSLLGKNVTVGVGDTYSGLNHIDLADRTINYNPRPPKSHGVMTSGIVGGAGIINTRARGVAPGSTIVNNYFTLILSRANDYHKKHNMTLTNNSYAAIVGSCANAGQYDL